jgi:hypothetical protein
MALLLSGGYWYYTSYIVQKATPIASPSATEAVWKTKSEKTVNDFMGYFLKTRDTNGAEQAKKARDLLSITAQAKLETVKDKTGQSPGDLNAKLDALMLEQGLPIGYQIISTKKIDEQTVEISIKLSYNNKSDVRIFSVVWEGSAWLIDSIKENTGQISPSPANSSTPSISPSAVSPLPSPTPQPTSS